MAFLGYENSKIISKNNLLPYLLLQKKRFFFSQ